ncbi:MAG TPA: peptidoglycan-binding protein [Pilimelia sp.]|nr:peptidoglycan-binding protein [Pilimelia sp.]
MSAGKHEEVAMPDHHETSAAPPARQAVPTAPASRRAVLRTLATVPVGAALAGADLLRAGPAAAAPRDLRAGMTGEEVRELQIRVAGWAGDGARRGFLPITGSFDAATEAAVRRFQHAHGLPANGIVGPTVRARLTDLEAADGSTIHFEWAQFADPDGSGFTGGAVDAATVRENVRQLMYKLEALRHKAGGRNVVVRRGFHGAGRAPCGRSPGVRPPGAASARATTARGAGLHRYGLAVDVVVVGQSTYSTYRIAETCGFPGLGSYVRSWLHCESRVQEGQA